MGEALHPARWIGWRMFAAWADLRGFTRDELARRPSEAQLLFYLMLSGLIWFLGRAAILSAESAPAPDILRARIGAEFITSLFFRSLAFYLVAAIAGALARRFGGGGSWHATRTAVFWAALVAALPTLAITLGALAASGSAAVAASVTGLLGSLILAWAMAQGLAEAHGFASGGRVLLVMGALVAAVLAIVYGLVLMA